MMRKLLTILTNFNCFSSFSFPLQRPPLPHQQAAQRRGGPPRSPSAELHLTDGADRGGGWPCLSPVTPPSGALWKVPPTDGLGPVGGAPEGAAPSKGRRLWPVCGAAGGGPRRRPSLCRPLFAHCPLADRQVAARGAALVPLSPV